MPEPITLTNHNLNSVLNGDKPVMMLLSNGEGLRGDFRVAFNKAAQESKGIVFATADTRAHPELASRFNAGEKPVLVAWYCGEEIARRIRPWGTDVPLAIEMLNKAFTTANPAPSAETPETTKDTKEETVVTDSTTPIAPDASATVTDAPVIIVDAPVIVTDATFEQEVLESDLPVMVDFWAAWCGPCRMVAPVLEKLAKEFAGQIKIAKVNVDENPGLSQAFQIRSIPNLMIVKQRTIIFNQPGALPEAPLRDLIQQAIKLQIPAQPATPAKK